MPNTNQQQDPNVTDSQSEKIRYGAPDGPRQNRQSVYDGREPLKYSGHEATAQFLATPETQREFDSVSALAKHFNVSRTTVYRWIQDIDVIQRANSLSMRNQMAGDLLARRDWPLIMGKAVQMARNGDVHAMKFCATRAWAEDQLVEHSHLSAGVSFEELVGTSEGDDAEEPQADNGQSDGGDR
jgi:hypothetical protein